MSKVKGNLLLTLAPPGDRTPDSSTSRRMIKGNLVWASVGGFNQAISVGEIWAQINIVNLDHDPGRAVTVLCNGYVTDGCKPFWQGSFPILEGDMIQLQAKSSVAGVQLYADCRFREGVSLADE